MVSTVEIAWVAGLVEGEGSVSWNDTPMIQVQMTDRDVVEHLARLWGTRMGGPTSKGGSYKPIWHVKVCGSRGVSWMMTLYSLMGTRRQAVMGAVLSRWKASPGTPRASRGHRWPAICHPERSRTGHGLCKQCYMVRWRAKVGVP